MLMTLHTLVERSEVDNALAICDAIIRNEGLEPHDDKTDVHPAGIWNTHVESRTPSEPRATFVGLVSNVTQYLAHNPDEFDNLRARFRGEGFSLPFTSARSISRYGPFRRLARKFLQYVGISTLAVAIKPEEMLRDANRLRREFEERAVRVAASAIPSTGIQRRWVIQDVRYTFNRLLYLVPQEDLPKYSALLPDIDEIVQTRELYNAMVQGDVSNLIHYTGPAVTAFAQLWSETQSHSPHLDWSAAPKAHEGDAVITLALYGLCEPPPEWITQFTSRTGYNQTALKLAAHSFPTERTHGDFSYIDELGSTLPCSPQRLTRLAKDAI